MGFVDVAVGGVRWNAFAGAPIESEGAIEYGTEGIVIFARKPVGKGA